MARKRLLFLFSDTGGGHRSAAEALIEAMNAEHGAAVECVMVDALKHYAPPPFHRTAEWYARVANRQPWQWALIYAFTNNSLGFRLCEALLIGYVTPNIRRFFRENPADVYVSVHPVLTQTVRMLGPGRPPFLTVVTDLASAHRAWFASQVNACVVPTERVRQIALRAGMPPEKLHVLGLPVAARFSAPPGDRAALRAQLNWSIERPIILLMGGGEGIGPLFEITQALSEARLACELVVVAGRNQKLLERLRATQWNLPVHAYGFVRTMPDFMRAADVLVSKAGPGTLSEAFIAGLPIILYSRLPGQEEGNVAWVVEEGAGVWAPTPEHVVAALRRWLDPAGDPAALSRAAANARRLGRPNAARDIAEVIGSYL